MSGLLGDVLPFIYGQSNRLKRHLGGLLSDPVGTMEQTAGGLLDSHRVQQGLLSQAMADPKKPFKVTDKNALEQAAMNMLNGPLGIAPMGITAWHGSPHKFDKFDSSKIGTGEGAQAYGHGLYLAESPEVAKSYQSALSADRGFSFGGKTGLTRAEVQDMVNAKYGGGYLDGVIRPSGVADSFLDDMVTGTGRAEGAYPRQYKPGSQRAKIYDELRGQIQHADPGSLYKVDLPDDAIAKMLDWDKPLHRQPKHVRKFLQSEVGDRLGRDTYADWIRNRPDWRDFQDNMMSHVPVQEVTERARQAGIPGIRYLDGGSRGAGAGSSNFVVFPGEENMLRILERNGSPLR